MSETSPLSFIVRDGRPEGIAGVAPFLDPADDPLARGRRYHASDGKLSYGAGVAETGPCDVRIAAMPHTEFVVVWDGEVTLQGADGNVLKLLPGDCAVIPRGTKVRWVQAAPVTRGFVVVPDAAGNGAREVLKIDPSVALEPVPAPAANVLTTAAPEARGRRLFEARGGQVRVGVWECTSYGRRQVTPPHCELMQILSGTVVIAEEKGATFSVGPGEAILVPAGATNAWMSAVTVRKVYCIVG